jgi:hypothetical protein
MSGDEDLTRQDQSNGTPYGQGSNRGTRNVSSGRQLVRGSGGEVRVTGTTEDTKVIVARGTEESMVRGGSWETVVVWRLSVQKPGSEGCA